MGVIGNYSIEMRSVVSTMHEKMRCGRYYLQNKNTTFRPLTTLVSSVVICLDDAFVLASAKTDMIDASSSLYSLLQGDISSSLRR